MRRPAAPPRATHRAANSARNGPTTSGPTTYEPTTSPPNAPWRATKTVWAALATLAALLGAAGWWAAQPGQPPGTHPPVASTSATSGDTGTGTETQGAADRAAATIAPALALAGTSLRGTEMDGDWGIDANGRFRPTLALRQRFDYHLSLQGELSTPEITRLVADTLRRSHVDPAASEVMALWSRYVELQQHAWRVVADPRDPATLGAALAERVPVRRAYLGAVAADAFYKEEEDEFRDRVSRMNAGLPAAPPKEATDPPLRPDADARLAALRAEQSAWEQRLAASRAALQRIERNPALSPAQREAEANAHFAQHYAASEQLRARVLLGQ